MKTRRKFISGIIVGIGTLFSVLFAASCGKKPDAATEPSPEWPPKE